MVTNCTLRSDAKLKLWGLASIILLLGIVVLLGVNPSTVRASQPAGTTPGAPELGTRTPTVTATREADVNSPACSIQFSDVPYDVPFYGPILCLACQGVLNGYSDETFLPERTATRGQLVKLIANAAGYADVIPQDRQTFTDVPDGFPFWLYIERAALHGVISGYDNGTFRPNADVTRGQAVKILDNAARYADSIP